MAFGEMMLLPDDFYCMSWREFFLMVRGFRKKEESDFLKKSLLAREVAYQVYCSIPLKKGKRHMARNKYWPHPFDGQKEDKNIEMLKKAMETLKARNNGPRD